MGEDRPNGYRLQLASSVGERDGMGLELLAADGPNDVIAEVFHDDVTGETSFALADGKRLPLDVLEWFLSEARAASL